MGRWGGGGGGGLTGQEMEELEAGRCGMWVSTDKRLKGMQLNNESKNVMRTLMKH